MRPEGIVDAQFFAGPRLSVESVARILRKGEEAMTDEERPKVRARLKYEAGFKRIFAVLAVCWAALCLILVAVVSRGPDPLSPIKCIGKESNALEEVDSGMVHDAAKVYTEYPDPRRDEWETKIRPTLVRIPLSQLVKETGMSRRSA